MHCASLFGLAHRQYSAPGTHSHSYEEYFDVIERLGMTPSEKQEAFRRMVFNVLGCNRDDHAKNFGFMLEPSEGWRLSPAFDVTYAHNPQPGKWTATQQMSIMGKRQGISRDDLIAIGRQCSVATKPKLNTVIDQILHALGQWPRFAEEARLNDEQAARVERAIAMQ